jgi:hypothetical protein
MYVPTHDEIQLRFPIGDRIEYQTGKGWFSGLIIGYESDKYGISLHLGDRRFPIWDEKGFQLAEKFHKSAHSVGAELPEELEIMKPKNAKVKNRTHDQAPKLEQLTLF